MADVTTLRKAREPSDPVPLEWVINRSKTKITQQWKQKTVKTHLTTHRCGFLNQYSLSFHAHLKNMWILIMNSFNLGSEKIFLLKRNHERGVL